MKPCLNNIDYREAPLFSKVDVFDEICAAYILEFAIHCPAPSTSFRAMILHIILLAQTNLKVPHYV